MRYLNSAISPDMLLILAIAGVVVLFLFLFWMSLLQTHWLIRAAERELMDLVHRIENAEASRLKKVEEKTALFSKLVSETLPIYSAPASGGGDQLLVGELGHNPFHQEIKQVLDLHEREMQKLAKRKATVRLNAALLRELLYGTGYRARETKLADDERDKLMGTIAQLGKVGTGTVWMSAALFGHPGSHIAWPPARLTGKQALDHLCHV